MRTFNFLCVCICFAGPLSQAALSQSGLFNGHERPTLLNTADPRPDILPRPFYDNHTEYRARYNRPTFIGGFLAYEMSRTSQEAMVWKENYCAGNYDQHHMPPVYKTYNYPKPWEALNVGARPDFASNKPITQRVPGPGENIGDDETSKEESSRKSKSENTSNAQSGSKSEGKSQSDEKANADQKNDAKEVEQKKPELVPSPSDKTSSRSLTNPRPISTKPGLKKDSSVR